MKKNVLHILCVIAALSIFGCYDAVPPSNNECNDNTCKDANTLIFCNDGIPLLVPCANGCKGNQCISSCGDGVCSDDENCTTCPKDCGICPTSCGDGVCNDDENCTTCPKDCGICPTFCGDGVCGDDENCTICPKDCGICPTFCGDGVCSVDENCTICPKDCGICPTFCGDGICSDDENCTTCPQDCGNCCNQHICKDAYTLIYCNNGIPYDVQCTNGCQDNQCAVCTNGTTQCSGKTLQTCTNGQWVNAKICDLACINNQCAVCTNGATQCAGKTLQTCANGQWGNVKTCDLACIDNQCAVCTNGATQCSGKTLQTCTNGQWVNYKTCDLACLDNKCAVCTNGTTQCSGKTLQTCTNGQWVNYKTCDLACVDSKCAVCTNGATQCSGKTLQTCTNGQWVNVKTCDLACVDSKCAVCTSGTTQCAGKTLQTCTHGQWVNTKTCDLACLDNKCAVCTSGTAQCSGKTLQTCTHGQWVNAKTCDLACINNKCAVCTNGAKQCSNKTVQICTNGAWVNNVTCSDKCSNGVCVSTDPVAGESCDKNTYEGGCSSDGTKRYYCSNAGKLVEKNCNTGTTCVVKGNNSSICEYASCTNNGAKQCFGNIIQICKNGQWVNDVTCSVKCANGACVSSGSMPTGDKCDKNSFVEMCANNVGYYCGSDGVVYALECDNSKPCAVRATDTYADCAETCKAGDPAKSVCMDYYGYPLAIQYNCVPTTDGGYAYFMGQNYEFCESSCVDGKCNNNNKQAYEICPDDCQQNGQSCVDSCKAKSATSTCVLDSGQYIECAESCSNINAKQPICITVSSGSYALNQVCTNVDGKKLWITDYSDYSKCANSCNTAGTACEGDAYCENYECWQYLQTFEVPAITDKSISERTSYNTQYEFIDNSGYTWKIKARTDTENGYYAIDETSIILKADKATSIQVIGKSASIISQLAFDWRSWGGDNDKGTLQIKINDMVKETLKFTRAETAPSEHKIDIQGTVSSIEFVLDTTAPGDKSGRLIIDNIRWNYLYLNNDIVSPTVGEKCDSRFVGMCASNTGYYCESGEVSTFNCDSSAPCVVRAADTHAECAESCKAGDPTKTLCTNYYGYPLAIQYTCDKTTDGNYAYFMGQNYEFCKNSCIDGICVDDGSAPDDPVAGASCDKNTYDGGCSNDGTKRYYCGNDGKLVEKTCNNGTSCVVKGNNSSVCEKTNNSLTYELCDASCKYPNGQTCIDICQEESTTSTCVIDSDKYIECSESCTKVDTTQPTCITVSSGSYALNQVCTEVDSKKLWITDYSNYSQCPNGCNATGTACQ